jgi:hypothetical protein
MLYGSRLSLSCSNAVFLLTLPHCVHVVDDHGAGGLYQANAQTLQAVEPQVVGVSRVQVQNHPQ